MEKHRCSWVNENNDGYVKYHDEEWGRPLYEDQKLYELLMLECFQAGLSWECVLNKREHFREAFDGFEPEIVAAYGAEKLEALLLDPGIIRNRRKILAVINNSRVFLEIQQEKGSFSAYLWAFSGGKRFREPFTERTTSPLAETISRDLKKRGMTFVGPVTVYAYLQAMGMIDAHSEDCFCYDRDKGGECNGQ